MYPPPEEQGEANPPGSPPEPDPTEPPDKLIGQRFGVEGSLAILERLGEGGMGVVYKAWDERHERLLAIKFLRPERVVDREIVSRFKREGRNFSRIKHPLHALRAHRQGFLNQDVFATLQGLNGQ